MKEQGEHTVDLIEAGSFSSLCERNEWQVDNRHSRVINSKKGKKRVQFASIELGKEWDGWIQESKRELNDDDFGRIMMNENRKNDKRESMNNPIGKKEFRPTIVEKMLKKRPSLKEILKRSQVSVENHEIQLKEKLPMKRPIGIVSCSLSPSVLKLSDKDKGKNKNRDPSQGMNKSAKISKIPIFRSFDFKPKAFSQTSSPLIGLKHETDSRLNPSVKRLNLSKNVFEFNGNSPPKIKNTPLIMDRLEKTTPKTPSKISSFFSASINPHPRTHKTTISHVHNSTVDNTIKQYVSNTSTYDTSILCRMSPYMMDRLKDRKYRRIISKFIIR